MTHRKPIAVGGGIAVLAGAWLIFFSRQSAEMTIRREYVLDETRLTIETDIRGRRERTGRVTWPSVPRPTITKTGEREWTIDFPGKIQIETVPQ